MASKEQVIRLLKNVTQSEARKLVLELHGELVENTPVDTGWARNNWIPTIGSPQDSPVGTPDKIETEAQQQGALNVASWLFSQGAAWIANNVPYIQVLNAGSSKQAPKGFVEKAIQKVVDKFNRNNYK